MTKYSISSYTADGVTTDFLITWDYLDKNHIATYVASTDVSSAGSGYVATLINQSTVRVTTELGAPVPAPLVVEIRRQTPIDTAAVTFNDGSSLNGEDLNKNTDYLLYAMQEALDTVDIAAQDGAQAAQTATEGFRDEAEGFKDTAGVFALEAQTAATNASNSEAAVAASAAAALQSEINAAGHELVAGTHATDAGNERALAQTAKTEAEAAKTASEAARDASQSAKAASETAAQLAAIAANSAEASWDFFDDRYLGSKASAPTLDNDGDPLVSGAIYWNSTGSVLQIYNGSSWENVATLSSDPSFSSVTATAFNGDDFFVDTNTGLALVAPATAGMVVGGTVIAQYGPSGVDVTGTLSATTVDLGNWTVTESGGSLYFATGGVNKMKLDATGNLTVTGDITAYGSIT